MKNFKKIALLCAMVFVTTSCGGPTASSSTLAASSGAPAASSSTPTASSGAPTASSGAPTASSGAPAASSSTPAASSSASEPMLIENKVTMEGQTLGLAKVVNARQLAGYVTTTGQKIKKDKLLRTGKLDVATPEDIAKLMGYGMHTVIDFRTTDEAAGEPDPKLPGVTQVHIKIYDESGDKETLSASKGETQDPGQLMVDLYNKGMFNPDMYTVNLKDPVVQAGFKEFLQLVAKESSKDGAILYHCTSGKDRVGIGTMLLLSILEVDRETILNDFALSNEFHKESIDYVKSAVAKITDDPAVIAGTVSLAGVERSNMEKTLTYLDETYGSPLQYITDVLGITNAEITALRENLLEPA